MVNYESRELDRIFSALVDPTRRAILARLEQEESVSISAIAEPFAIKLPAVMKHLDVLGEAGLVSRSKHGRTVDIRLSPAPLREAMDWLARYERFWSPALDRLAVYAEARGRSQRSRSPGDRGRGKGQMSSLTLVRRVAARPSIVFDALTTPEGVAAWWGPDDLPVIKAAIDARIGGAFSVRFRTLDGQEHEAFGEYLEVDRPARLAMTWRYAFGGEPEELGRTSRIEIDLRPVDGGTELTFTHADLRNAASQASHERGWTGSLAKLLRLFAGGQSANDRV